MDDLLNDIDIAYNDYEYEHTQYIHYLKNRQIVVYIPKDYFILTLFQCYSIVFNLMYIIYYKKNT